MSNRLFQGIIQQMHKTMNCEIGVIDENAVVIACSDTAKIGYANDFVALEGGDVLDSFIRDGYTFKPLGGKAKFDYAVYVEGTDETAYKYHLHLQELNIH